MDRSSPFDWTSDSDNGSDESGVHLFVEAIYIPSCTGTQDIFVPTLLDAGMKVNAMTESKSRQTGI
jgi:hypothetical protein